MNLKEAINGRVMKVVLSLVLKYIAQMSPSIIKSIEDMLLSLQAKAEETTNPMDDILVDLLQRAFAGIIGKEDTDESTLTP